NRRHQRSRGRDQPVYLVGATQSGFRRPVAMISVDVNESNLNLLRISLDLTGVGAGPRVLFDIRVGGEQIGLLEASSDEIGLPPTLSEARERDASDAQQVFHIPDYVLTALESVIPPDGKPLWLSLGQPYG